MLRLPLRLLVMAGAFTTACVTINVYFPAAAAEEAADRIIEDVWGPTVADDEDGQATIYDAGPGARAGALVRLASLSGLDVRVPPAHAQGRPDVDGATPGIRARTKRRIER